MVAEFSSLLTSASIYDPQGELAPEFASQLKDGIVAQLAAANGVRFAGLWGEKMLEGSVPKHQRGAFTALQELQGQDALIPVDTLRELVGSVAEIAEIVSDIVPAFAQLGGAFASLGRAVPVAGWFVEAGLAVYKFARLIKDMADRGDPPPQPTAALAYNAGDDELGANAWLTRGLEGDDLTRYFLPGGVLWQAVESVTAYGRPGIKVALELIEGEAPGLGYFPGRGLVGTYQLAFGPAFAIGPPGWSRRSWASFNPSTSQAADTMWATWAQPGPWIWKVSAPRVTSMWTMAATTPIAGIRSQGGHPAGDAIDNTRAQLTGGAGQVLQVQPFADGVTPLSGGAVMQAQAVAANTIAVAYAAPDSPAMEFADLAELVDERKRQLLEHPDRIHVDEDLVVDAEWRTEWAKRTPPGLRMTAGAPLRPQLPPIVGSGGAPDGSDGGDAGEAPSGDGGGSGLLLLGGVVLVVGAGAGLAYGLSRRRGRR